MKTFRILARLSPNQFVLLVVLTLLLAASPLSAHTILLDLGDNFSDMSAQNWNTVIFNQAVQDLVDDTGAPTGVSFMPLFWGGDFQNSANWIEDLDWVLKEAATDHFGGFSNSTITFGNLNGIYRLEVVSSHPQTNHLTDITVNDQFSSRNFQNLPGVNGDDFDPEQDGRVAQNWLIWDDITPISGNITLRVIKLAGTNAISVNALRLTRTGDIQSSDVSATLTAAMNTIPEPGGSVSFTATLDNSGEISAEITSLTHDIFGDLNGQGDCSLPLTVTASGSYECTFAGFVTGNAGDSQTGTLFVSGSDSSGAVSAQDSETVDIVDALPTATVDKTSNPTMVDEPGGEVTFTVVVSNTSQEALDLTALVDDIHGDLDGQGDCSMPQTIAVSSSYMCSFTATVSGNAGDSETDTVTATLSDDEGNNITPQDSATVTVADVPATGTVTKSASPTTLDEPGGEVLFTVEVSNTGTAESLTLSALVDDIHGDLDGQGDCSVPQTIAASSSYTCSFTATVTGNAGDSETDTVTATLSDDDGNTIMPTGSATVTLEDVEPTATATKLASGCDSSIEEPGGQFTFWVEVTNTSGESVELIDLVDDVYGDLDTLGDCSVPQTLAAAASYSCSFTGTFNGSAGDSETSTVTATVEDDEENQVAPTGSVTIHIETAGSTLFTGCFESGDLKEWGFFSPIP